MFQKILWTFVAFLVIAIVVVVVNAETTMEPQRIVSTCVNIHPTVVIFYKRTYGLHYIKAPVGHEITLVAISHDMDLDKTQVRWSQPIGISVGINGKLKNSITFKVPRGGCAIEVVVYDEHAGIGVAKINIIEVK